jgi:hypothetical protein
MRGELIGFFEFPSIFVSCVSIFASSQPRNIWQVTPPPPSPQPTPTPSEKYKDCINDVYRILKPIAVSIMTEQITVMFHLSPPPFSNRQPDKLGRPGIGRFGLEIWNKGCDMIFRCRDGYIFHFKSSLKLHLLEESIIKCTVKRDGSG